MPVPQTLPVNEVFYAFQGEGLFMGCAAFFIRLQGCPIRCAFCDSASTWDSKNGKRMRIDSLVAAAKKEPANIVVITGGEPAVHDLRALCQKLHAAGKRVHIETSGAFALRGKFDFITVSPKKKRPPLPKILNKADEIKLIIDSPAAIAYWLKRLPSPLPKKTKAILLQPEFSKHQDPRVLNAITRAVKTHGNSLPLRATVQLHKLYNADALDKRARK